MKPVAAWCGGQEGFATAGGGEGPQLTMVDERKELWFQNLWAEVYRDQIFDSRKMRREAYEKNVNEMEY
jgi:hypothetical protein